MLLLDYTLLQDDTLHFFAIDSLSSHNSIPLRPNTTKPHSHLSSTVSSFDTVPFNLRTAFQIDDTYILNRLKVYFVNEIEIAIVYDEISIVIINDFKNRKRLKIVQPYPKQSVTFKIAYI